MVSRILGGPLQALNGVNITTFSFFCFACRWHALGAGQALLYISQCTPVEVHSLQAQGWQAGAPSMSSVTIPFHGSRNSGHVSSHRTLVGSGIRFAPCFLMQGSSQSLVPASVNFSCTYAVLQRWETSCDEHSSEAHFFWNT